MGGWGVISVAQSCWDSDLRRWFGGERGVGGAMLMAGPGDLGGFFPGLMILLMTL